MGIFLLWTALSILCAMYASRLNRSKLGYFILSFLLSPIVGFITLLILGKSTTKTSLSSPHENNTHNEEDNYEGTYYGSVKDEIPCSLKLKIKYRDGNKNITDRDIEVKKIGETFDGDYMLLAHCTMRNATRTFYASRIIDLADLETGEFVKDKRDFFRSRINDYFNSEEYKVMLENQNRLEFKYSFVSRYKEVFEAMSYIVRVDGTFSQKERVIAREYIKKLEPDYFLDDEMVDSIFKNFGLIAYQSFQAKIRKIDENKMINFDMLEFAKEIIATQKTSTDAEDQIVSYLEKRKNK